MAMVLRELAALLALGALCAAALTFMSGLAYAAC